MNDFQHTPIDKKLLTELYLKASAAACTNVLQELEDLPFVTQLHVIARALAILNELDVFCKPIVGTPLELASQSHQRLNSSWRLYGSSPPPLDPRHAPPLVPLPLAFVASQNRQRRNEGAQTRNAAQGGGDAGHRGSHRRWAAATAASDGNRRKAIMTHSGGGIVAGPVAYAGAYAVAGGGVREGTGIRSRASSSAMPGANH
jgi:hypothetical protein